MIDHTFPLVEVEGSAYEMGYQHGAQAADLVQRYLLWIERLTGKSRDVLCRNAMDFWPLIESSEYRICRRGKGAGVRCGNKSGRSRAVPGACRSSAEAGRGLHCLCVDTVGDGGWENAGRTEPGPRAGIRRRRDTATRQPQRWPSTGVDVHFRRAAGLCRDERIRRFPFCQRAVWFYLADGAAPLPAQASDTGATDG